MYVKKKKKLCYITKEEPEQVCLPYTLTCSACETSFTVRSEMFKTFCKMTKVPPNSVHTASYI